MRKIVSIICILLILSNIFSFNTALAATQLQLNTFSIKVNWWSAWSGDMEVNPWDNLAILLSWENNWDTATNVEWEFTFSSNNFSYENQWTIDSYIMWSPVKQDISTSLFNPPIDNSAPISSSSNAWDYLDLYYLDLRINIDTTDSVLTIWAKLNADSYVGSNSITRNIYINSAPHIIGYYFEKSWAPISQIARTWTDTVDLIIKIKDYNWCDNIDSASVSANLLSLWLWTSETLNYVSCDTWTNTATYKKSWITTIASVWTKIFSHTDFSVTDEDWKVNNPNDALTTFDDEDKKTNLNLEVTTAGTPVVSIDNSIDNYIWSLLEQNTTLSFSWNQNGEVKTALWSDWTCVWWTIIQDWTLGYTWWTMTWATIDASILSEGNNTVYACVRNDEAKIWSDSINIIKDTASPSINSIIITPANIVLEDSSVKLNCSEEGEYRIELWGTWSLSSWTTIWTWSVSAWVEQTITVNNGDLWLDTNNLYAFCLDEASNYVWSSFTVTKTTPPPSMLWDIISFSDWDVDLDWLDGRDLSFSWDSANALWYTYFESYRLYLLPSNITYNSSSHNAIKIIPDSSIVSFVWDETILLDSLWDSLVDGWSYQMCINIMWTNWVLWTEDCSLATILTSDIVTHANILSAKFTSDTNLEVTTDTTLDIIPANHSWSLITYTYNSSTYTWITIVSVDDKKINIQVPSIWDISAVATDLTALTWSIRANWWGYNNYLTWGVISDGQTPVINNFIKNTLSSYNNFYTWSINFSYDFVEDMRLSYTKFEFIRVSWNLDSNNYYVNITWNNLLSWTHSQNIDLDSLNLVDGANYNVKITGQDSAWNYTETTSISNIKS